MSKDLTKRQKEILNFIKSFINTNAYPPTIKEISEKFKISQKGSYDHIKALQKKKYIDYKPKTRRSLKILVYNDIDQIEYTDDMFEIPLLGTVQAGLPILSYENFEGKIKIDKNMFSRGNLFGLKIRGDSMIDAGIHEGDIAIVKQNNYFNNGDIIVIETDNGITLKKGYKEKKAVKLVAANKSYPEIYSKNPRIIGKLIGLIRQY